MATAMIEAPAETPSNDATLVFLDFPEGSEFGVDYKSWNVGPKFRGIKSIPPGVHFIYYSACDARHQAAPRSGFFHNFKPGELVVRKWDKYNEDIMKEGVSDQEMKRITDNMAEISHHLGPYPMDSYKTWVSLTSHLKRDNLARLQPESITITAVPQLISEPSDSRSRLDAARVAKGVATKQDVVIQQEVTKKQEVANKQEVEKKDGMCDIQEIIEGDGDGHHGMEITNSEKVVNSTSKLAKQAEVTGDSKNQMKGDKMIVCENDVRGVDKSENKIEELKGKGTATSEITNDIDEACVSKDKTRTPTKLDPYDNLPIMQQIPGTELRFTPIPKRKYPPDSTPQEITKYSMDSSYVLECILNEIHKTTNDASTALLGEIQFAFVCFLVGQVYDAFEQWKQLVAILCTSEEYLTKCPDLFQDFISVLYFEIREVPEDFFVDIVSQSNFLTTTLYEFFVNVESSDSVALRKRARQFKDHLTEKFKWDFSEEPNEYAPVVVDLSSFEH